MSLATIRAGLAVRLETIDGLRVYPYPPDSISELPCAYILPKGGDYDTTFDHGIRYDFEVVLLLAKGADVKYAQLNIDNYINRTGAKSVYAAIDGESTLGGSCDVCRVARFSEYGGLEYAGTVFLGCKWALEIYT